jgi:alpha-mannosidase
MPGVRRVDVRADFVNPAPDHRLRVLFPTGRLSEDVIVDGHFDRLRRPPVNLDVGEGWAERPALTAAQRAFTAIEQDGRGLLIAARGLPEYEHIRSDSESTLALTLLRAVGWLSRDDLDCRPGHAGPARATPGAQGIGPAAADYSLIPFVLRLRLGQAAQAAYAFAPLRSVACVGQPRSAVCDSSPHSCSNWSCCLNLPSQAWAIIRFITAASTRYPPTRSACLFAPSRINLAKALVRQNGMYKQRDRPTVPAKRINPCVRIFKPPDRNCLPGWVNTPPDV